jgi:hypothetical protein
MGDASHARGTVLRTRGRLTSAWPLKAYLVSGRTVTIEGGVGRGSPLEKWIVARAIKATTMMAKATARRIGSILARRWLLQQPVERGLPFQASGPRLFLVGYDGGRIGCERACSGPLHGHRLGNCNTVCCSFCRSRSAALFALSDHALTTALDHLDPNRRCNLLQALHVRQRRAAETGAPVSALVFSSARSGFALAMRIRARDSPTSSSAYMVWWAAFRIAVGNASGPCAFIDAEVQRAGRERSVGMRLPASTASATGPPRDLHRPLNSGSVSPSSSFPAPRFQGPAPSLKYRAGDGRASARRAPRP